MPSDAAVAVRRWLNDILHNIELAESFMAGLDYDAFHSTGSGSTASLAALRSSPKRRAACPKR
jgi:uncharacterized protein with HEPN domain